MPNLSKLIVSFAMSKLFGIRGGLRPPLNNGSILYKPRRYWWRVVSILYDYSGLPVRWENWYEGER